MLRSLLATACLALLGILFLGAAAEAATVMSVQVREGEIRATPSFLGRVVARAAYGDRVTVTEERGPWMKVSLAERRAQGWMHTSALTTKRIVLKAGQATGSSVSQGEIALAGKGFNKEVENEYRKSHRDLDYAWIDRMEAFRVSQKQMEDFVAAGQLTPGSEGGRP